MNWLRMQTGIGMDFQDGAFHATCVKRQWNHFRVVDHLEIADYRRLEPAECGRRYREFLAANGLKVPWTVVALPRSAVLLRSLRLPAAVEKDVAQAVAYQLDALHPFEEGGVYWDCAVWKRQEATESGQIDVSVAIAQKPAVEEAAAWFREAGIAVSQFSVSSALLAGMFWSPCATFHKEQGFLLLDMTRESVELAGFAPGSGFLSREIPPAQSEDGTGNFPPAVLQELARARSELRIDPEKRLPLVLCGNNLPLLSQKATAGLAEDLALSPVSVEDLFPQVPTDHENFRLRDRTAGFAAALAAVDRALPLGINLLPEESRSYQSPLVYLPTYALAALVVLLATVLGLRGTVQDWLYSNYLEEQIAGLRPRLQEVERTQEESRETAERLALLRGARNAGRPLEVLAELTRLLPRDVWLQQVQLDGDTVSITGLAGGSASGLLQTLSASPLLESPQFLSAIQRTQQGEENFRIGVRLRAGASPQ